MIVRRKVEFTPSVVELGELPAAYDDLSRDLQDGAGGDLVDRDGAAQDLLGDVADGDPARGLALLGADGEKADPGIFDSEGGL